MCPAVTPGDRALSGRCRCPSRRRYLRRVNEDRALVVPRRLAAGVCWAEAAAVLVFATLVARAGARGAASNSSAAYTQVAIAVVIAIAIAGLGVALVRGRRWPIGLFVTTQILVAVISLSQVGAAMADGSIRIVMVSVLVGGLVCAAAGLWSAAGMASAGHGPPGSVRRGRG